MLVKCLCEKVVLLLLVYSTVVTVFLIAYFLPIKQALARVFGVMNFPQRFILLFAFFYYGFCCWCFRPTDPAKN